MTQAYEPEHANGFAGALQYDLRRGDGRVVQWTVEVGPQQATARPGPAGAPALTLKLTVADFLRMAARDLDAGKALLTGRLDLEGDFCARAAPRRDVRPAGGALVVPHVRTRVGDH